MNSISPYKMSGMSWKDGQDLSKNLKLPSPNKIIIGESGQVDFHKSDAGMWEDMIAKHEKSISTYSGGVNNQIPGIDVTSGAAQQAQDAAELIGDLTGDPLASNMETRSLGKDRFNKFVHRLMGDAGREGGFFTPGRGTKILRGIDPTYWTSGDYDESYLRHLVRSEKNRAGYGGNTHIENYPVSSGATIAESGLSSSMEPQWS